MDYLLKYVEIAAVPSLAASHVIEFLKTNFQWRHRMPKKLISDRSTTFRTRQLRSFLHRAEVGHHFASSYHPQANGLTERTNQTIQTRLAPYVETHKVEEADWDRHLQSAAYSANTSFLSSTGKTLCEFVYGQLPKLDVAASLDAPVKVGRPVDRQVVCHNIRTEARRNAIDAQRTQEKYYDRRHRRAPQYGVGDQVWVQRGTQATGQKLLPKFDGPFVITERLGANTWRVTTPSGNANLHKRKRDNFAVHMSRMKKKIGRAD